jgi:hypothetical protein
MSCNVDLAITRLDARYGAGFTKALPMMSKALRTLGQRIASATPTPDDVKAQALIHKLIAGIPEDELRDIMASPEYVLALCCMLDLAILDHARSFG